MRNNYQKIRQQKKRRFKKRYLVFAGLIAIFLDVVYSYTQNIKLVFLISGILITVTLVANLGTKIDTGKESKSSYGNYIR